MRTIFICIEWFHPAYRAGGPVQSIANLVNHYGEGQVNFQIFCSNKDLDGSVNRGVVFDEWVFHNERTQVWFASGNSVARFKRAVGQCKADVIFVIGIYSWYFNLVPLLFGKAPVKIISARGMLHPGALLQKSLKKNIYLFIWKLFGIQRRYFFHATDSAEKGFIQACFGKQARVFVAGNIPRVFSFQPVLHKEAGHLRMVSIALIGPMKNIALVLDALQYCKQSIEYAIYGPVKDDAYWQQCLVKINLLPSNIKVAYHGDLVPTQVENTLSAYEVFILPSKSENFGHAIVEALSAGKPVITSHYTPFNDLQEKKAGKNVAVENVEDITAAIDFFAAMEPDEFEVWNNGASAYAGLRMNMELLKGEYDAMFLGEEVDC
jgi:glycosyltransferase involved in cell wall biosynthesis